jgi:hypothetical protein
MTSLIALGTFAGTAGAAVPLAQASSEAIPAQYSAGEAAGFRGIYDYQDGSTLARLILKIETSGAASVAFRAATKNGAAVANACDTGVPVMTCTFRQIRFQDHLVVVAAFNPAASATSVSATFSWSTTGATPNDGGDHSHGDIWDGTSHTATLSTDPNYAGGFSTSSDGSISNLQVVTADNRQATGLASLPAGVAASVEDGPAIESSCTDTVDVDCSDVIGEWSEVFVGDGQSFETVFTITIVYYQGTPKGFVHTYGDPDDPEQEFIGPCPKKAPASGAPCFTWSARNNTATIYTFHNGSYKGLG